MDPVNQTASARGARGRWAPGQSGNPAGKKLGTRHRATRLRELLAEGDEEAAIQVLMDRVRAGDGVAARFVLDRLFPKPRDRDIDLGLSDTATPLEMFDRVLHLMAAGEITIDEASRIVRLMHQRRLQSDAAPASVERPATAAGAGTSPVFDLHLAGDAATDADTPATPSPPLNRHERRRAAALQRAAPISAAA